jgi:integrase/recombinase XerD
VPSPTTKTTSILDTDRNEKLHGEIEDIAAGLANAWTNNLLLLPQEIATTIVDYIKAMKSEVNLSDYYRRDVIDVLIKLYKHAKKSFKDLTRDDILLFLDSFRKPEEVDPLHKWIGTYNLYRIHLQRFFKWLYSPEVEHTKRSKPSVIDNIPKLKRKEVSIYKPSDLWTAEDDLLFLKFCPSARDRCFHAISRDLSCRPHEILKLKIRDVAFKTIGSSQYAEIVVNGKTGTRPIPLINSIPYLKDYLDHEHPMPRNPKAPLICGVGKGLGRHMRYFRMAHVYRSYKQKIFPTLLESPNVPPEDKKRIVELLKKPWNPYIRRHSALTEKSMILKESVLRQHAGWAPGSNMHLKYLHYFGNESSGSLLEAYGLVDHSIQIDQLRPRQCPNCNEGNKPDSKFCAKCRMVLSYDSYEETLENQKKKEDRLTTIENQFNTMQSQIQSLLSSLGTIQDQNQVNQMAKTLYNSKILNTEK